MLGLWRRQGLDSRFGCLGSNFGFLLRTYAWYFVFLYVIWIWSPKLDQYFCCYVIFYFSPFIWRNQTYRCLVIDLRRCSLSLCSSLMPKFIFSITRWQGYGIFFIEAYERSEALLKCLRKRKSCILRSYVHIYKQASIYTYLLIHLESFSYCDQCQGSLTAYLLTCSFWCNFAVLF